MTLQECFFLASKWYPNRSKLDWKRPDGIQTQKALTIAVMIRAF
jgi:hypothetical protein